MKIAVIGTGAISSFLCQNLAGSDCRVAAFILRQDRLTKGRMCDLNGTPCFSTVNDLETDISLLVDCAGHSGLSAHGPMALERGFDVLTVSIGALADPELASRLEKAAEKGGSRLRLASGAIGGLDALRAARVGRLDKVTYTGRKPPAGWVGSAAEAVIDLSRPLPKPVVHFSGSAREAALKYPKNANVAAAIALAGIGFDKTGVALIADPDVTTNIHEIEASGRFGDLRFTASGNSLPDNPSSSALAAMSVVASILESKKLIGF